MSLRFDNKVAIVTGGGGGLGRLYALALAERGAKVVVNDLGGSVNGTGSNTSAASLVVSEIKKAGGEAAADFNSVENGDRIVETAIKNYGRIDIVINNAGILRDKSFQNMTEEDWDLVHKVHLKGTFMVSRAAFKHMRAQGYGRIINISSAAGIYGNFGQANYGAAKLGLVGLTHNLAIEGASKNIKVNVIAPLANSRMTDTVWPEEVKTFMGPEHISPLVVYLAHESCEDSAGLFEVFGGWVGRLRFQRTKGAVFDISRGFSAEDVKNSWGKINDWSDVEYPTQSSAASSVMERVSAQRGSAKLQMSNTKTPSNATSKAADVPSTKSAPFFKLIGDAIARDGATLANKVKGSVQWEILGADKKVLVIYGLDLKEAPGSFSVGKLDKPTATISVSDDDFCALAEGKLNPQTAFMQGKIKLKGSMALAMKLNVILDAAKPKGGAPKPAAAPLKTNDGPATKSAPFFKLIGEAIARDGANLANKVKGSVQWEILGADKKLLITYGLDLKQAPGSFSVGKLENPTATISVSDDDFCALAEGKLNPQTAFMQGKIKLKGSMALAMKLNVILDAAKPKSKL